MVCAGRVESNQQSETHSCPARRPQLHPNLCHQVFCRFAGSFGSVADPTGATPYNQTIQTGVSQAIPSFTTLAWQPRLGFAWSPTLLKDTVLRGGIGLFMDTFPGQIADSISSNTPVLNQFPQVIFGNIAPQQVANGGNIFSTASISNTALTEGFFNGSTLAQIQTAAAAAGGVFAAPGFNNVSSIRAPEYWEWNFEVQHAIGGNTSVNINYVGNH